MRVRWENRGVFLNLREPEVVLGQVFFSPLIFIFQFFFPLQLVYGITVVLFSPRSNDLSWGEEFMDWMVRGKGITCIFRKGQTAGKARAGQGDTLDLLHFDFLHSSGFLFKCLFFFFICFLYPVLINEVHVSRVYW
ncbi:hypothetical protein QBC42DRAFT_57765 [Cladorrhinum samala]|uniref:Uncharacterized protein n=1 Tax=Cladorrhinum samala TaxID=585594 RepID=A0AAV9H770_9PEZI|nr:hypothetical protein QBC42DRAFT_57765 [Cladorrhinum samala]